MLVSFTFAGCAILHHVQVGEVDSKIVRKGEKIEILVTETGVSFKEGTQVAQALTHNKQTKKDLGDAQAILSMFQMGPVTGNHVFSDKFADRVFKLIRRKCPSGRVSGVTSIRETAKYPVVSGEIVKITGYCG